MRVNPRLQFRGKLLLAFLLVLSPLPFLSIYSLRTRISDQTQSFLLTQRSTSQAVAISLEITLERMTDTAWMLAGDPLVSAMNPQELDGYLESRSRASSLFLGIAVFNEAGQNRGWGIPGAPANPRIDISGSELFRRALAINNAAVGNILTFDRLPARCVVIGVPIRNRQGLPKGLLTLILSTREMARHYQEIRRQVGQVIFAFDRRGVLIFHTMRPDLSLAEQSPMRNESLDAALAGVPADYTDIVSPITGHSSIGSLTPVRRLGWVAGASIRRDVALTGAYNEFYRNIVGLLLVLGLSSAMAYVLALLISRPITRLKEQAKQIGEGNLSARSHIATHDELQELAEDFNETAARLEKREEELAASLTKEKEARSAAEHAIRIRDDFLAIASHELKTPITPLSMRIDLLTRLVAHKTLSSLSEQRLGNLLLGFRQDLDRLVALINDLLDVSQIEAGRLALHLAAIDISELVEGLLTRLTPLFPAQIIDRQIERGIHCTTDALRMEQILTNLMTNAAKYGKGNPITVTLAQRNDRIMLSVMDRGIGIAPEDQKRIFEKFERAVSLRSFGGLGLGLYITRRLTNLLGGSIQVESEPGKGSMFTVEFPQRTPAPAPSATIIGTGEELCAP